MRHRVRSRTLGRQTGHRIAMLRNLATSLLRHGRITTTQTRAKELSRFAESLISSAMRAHTAPDDNRRLAHKRRVFRHISDREVAQVLFDVIAPRYVEGGELARQGGYTRSVKLGFRRGDGAPMSLIELVTD